MVTVLFKYFAFVEEVPYDAIILDRVLHHDLLEVATGDLPYDVKNLNGGVKNNWNEIEGELIRTPEYSYMLKYHDSQLKGVMNDMQWNLFKACDLLDLWIFIKEEIGLGNSHKGLALITKTCEKIIDKMDFPHIHRYMKKYDEYENK